MGRKSSTNVVQDVVQDKITAVQDKAAELAEQLKDAKLDERAAELAERVRDSEAFRTAQVKAAELAAVTRQMAREAHLDERAVDLAERVRDSAGVQAAAANVRDVSDRALLRLGGWLSEGKTAERLHLEPAKRRFPGWLAMILGLGAGYLIGMLTSGKRDDLSSEFGSGDAWTPPPPSPTPTTDLSSSTGAAATGGLEGGTGGIEAGAPPQSLAQKPLEDRVRTALGQDPRTADLPRLNVNVVEGTVFVRGSAPAGFDEAALRTVVADVEGVTDVDLQVSADA